MSMRSNALSISLFLLSLFAHAPAALATWTSLNPLPTGNHFEDIAWNGSQLLAVGDNGLIATSTDGSNWTLRDAGTVQKLYAAYWDGAQYLVTGESGVLLTSPDGITWTQRDTNVRRALLGIAGNGAGLHVAVGAADTRGTVILTSSDGGASWTRVTTTLGASMSAITYDGAQFVAVGSSLTIATSPDGSTWTTVNSFNSAVDPNCDPTLGDPKLEDISWNAAGSRFVAVGFNGTILTSADGTTWTRPTLTAPMKTNGCPAGLYGVVWNGVAGEFIVVGWDGAILTGSADASTWTIRRSRDTTDATLADQHIEAIAYDSVNNQYVAVGNRLILTSPGATTWTTQTQDPAGAVRLEGSLWDGGQYLAVGGGGTVLTSPDGHNWTAQAPVTANRLYDIAYDGVATYVAVGAAGTIITDNGGGWGAQTVGGDDLYALTWDGTRFLAVGANGAALTSADGGVTWTPPTWANPSALPVTLYDVIFDGSQFLAVGASGNILAITESGGTWTWAGRYSTGGTLRGIVYDGSRYVAVGDGGVIVTSSNGTSWSPSVDYFTSMTPRNWTTADLYAVAAIADQVVAVGTGATILSTRDASWWSQQGVTVSAGLAGLAWNGTEFVAVGDAGAILASGGLDISLQGFEPVDPLDGIIHAGDDAAFEFRISNNGNINASTVSFSAPLPAGTTLFDLQGPDAAKGNCDIVTAPVTCTTIGHLDAGSPAALMIVTITPSAAGLMTVNAAIGEASASDTNTVNDRMSVSVDVAPADPNLPNPNFPDDTISGGRGALTPWPLLGLLLWWGWRRRAPAHASHR